MDGNTPTMMQSEKERAPWNEKKVPERDFPIVVVCTIYKMNAQVCTSDYIPEIDEDGDSYANTENTDWATAYKRDHYTIPQLLNILQGYVIKELRDDNVVKTKNHKDKLKHILDDCDGWILDSESYDEV